MSRRQDMILRLTEALRLLGRGNGMAAGGQTATLTIAEVAQVTNLTEDEVRELLVNHAGKVWAKLPIGWAHRVPPGGTHVELRRGN